MAEAEEIAEQMTTDAAGWAIQVVQTEFRMQLVRSWRIPDGAKVLEIGCGQGDMTAVLANAVGDRGHVIAVDIADPGYGAPVTLGEATARLKVSSLGARIDFRLRCDILDPACSFMTDSFDYVVLAHSSWYCASLDVLRDILLRVRPWAKRLCYSEWDIEPRSTDQVAHMLAVLIQGQVEAYKTDSEANVRTPFSRTRLKGLLRETGWGIITEEDIDTSALQDARWEIGACLRSSVHEAEELDLPSRHQALLSSQVDVLRAMAADGLYRPLPSYAIVAE